MRVRIKNNHGQALIETSVVLGFITGAIFTSLKMASAFILTISMDDFLESYVLCSTYRNPVLCQTLLNQKIKSLNLHLVTVHIRTDSNRTVAELIVRPRSNKNNENIVRTREYVKK